MTRNITRPLTGLAAAAALFAFAAAPALAESMLGDETEGTALVPISQNARYIVNPPLSDATIEKRKKGYFTADGGGKDSATVCLEDINSGDEGWEVKIGVNCVNPTGDTGEEDFEGGLAVNDEGDWELDVEYDEDDVCWMSGSLDIEGPMLKTDVKCTDAARGPNKNSHKHGTGSLQVDAEIKRVDTGCDAD